MLPMSPESLLQSTRQFMEPRILLTGVELGIFPILANGPLSSAAITARLRADTRGIAIVLDALAAIGALTKLDNQYSLPEGLRTALTEDGPDSILPMLRHTALLWRRWNRLTELVGAPDGEYLDGSLHAGDAQRAFIGAMHVIASRTAPDIAVAISAGSARRLIDVGGASGSYTIALLQRHPAMSATLFDLPPVVEMARDRIAAAGLADRVEFVGGNFDTDDLPPGHDLALLSAIIHQNSRDENVALYRKIAAALAPGGRLVIRDHVMSEDRTQPPDGALFAVNMLVGTPGGSCYTLAEIADDLATAGFARISQIRSGHAMDSLIEAFLP